MSVKKCFFSLCVCISFARVFSPVSQLVLVCNKGFCEWRSDTIYTGCLPNDISVWNAIAFLCDSIYYICCVFDIICCGSVIMCCGFNILCCGFVILCCGFFSICCGYVIIRVFFMITLLYYDYSSLLWSLFFMITLLYYDDYSLLWWGKISGSSVYVCLHATEIQSWNRYYKI